MKEKIHQSQVGYCLKTKGGPLTPLPLEVHGDLGAKSAILMKGIPLFIPYSFRSKAIVPFNPAYASSLAPEIVNARQSLGFGHSPRIVKVP